MSGNISKLTRRTYANCSRIISNSNLQKKAKWAIPAGVAGIWGAQTALEVHHAIDEDKKNAFINNAIIGGAMVLGGIVGHFGFQRFLDKKVAVKATEVLAEQPFIKQLPERFGRFLRKFPTKDFLHALSIPVSSGILGGVAGEFGQRKFPVKYNEPDEVIKKAEKVFDFRYGPVDKIDEFPGAGLIDTVHPSFSTVVGLSVGKQKGIKNKVKEFVFEIISGVLVPVAFVLPVTRILNKKNVDKSIAGLATVGLSVSASLVGKFAASWFNKKVTDKVIERKFWKDITERQRHLMKAYMFTDNPYQKHEIQKQVKELKELGEKVKNSEVDVRDIARKAPSEKTDEKKIIVK